MRRDFFERGNDFRILLYKILHGEYRDPSILHREEQRVFVGRNFLILLLLCKVSRQRVSNFFRKIQDRFVTAFSCYNKRIIAKIDAFVIQADKLGNTYSGSQKERKYSDVADLRFIVITECMRGEFCAILCNVQNRGDFVAFKTNNFLFVKFR